MLEGRIWFTQSECGVKHWLPLVAGPFAVVASLLEVSHVGRGGTSDAFAINGDEESHVVSLSRRHSFDGHAAATFIDESDVEQ